ncbi:MAG: phosphatidate cytidylyltransferase [Arenicellales bacterium]
MLRIRVLTAVVLAPLFVLGVFTLSELQFAVMTGLFVLVGAWEWTSLSGYNRVPPKVLSVAVVSLLMMSGYAYRDTVAQPVTFLACAAWLVVALLLFRHRHRHPMVWPRPVRWLCGACALLAAWLAISVLREASPGAALMLFLLVWAADVGAYFAGRRWGRHKLAPAISPGKTVEGLWGGIAAALVVAAAFALHWDLSPGAAVGLTAWSVAVVLLSVFGDLFESNWKRTAELKDSGGLLPGHGGVLDRIDSVMAAAPFFALGWLWWFSAKLA